MSQAKTFLKYWLPVVLWMAVVFGASSDAQSGQHSSRIIEPVLRWLFPQMSAAARDDVVFACRKVAHVTEYGIFALLLWRALRRPVRRDPRPWSWPQARLAVLLAAIYAATDEFHQAFVPTREARVHDVVIDTCGAALALWLLWAWGRWRRRW